MPCSPFESQLTFWRNISPPSSGLKDKPSKIPALLALVSCSAYSSTLKMEVILSSEASVDFQWTKQYYISKDTAPLNHCYENHESYIKFMQHKNKKMSLSSSVCF
jgi:hypothetical protein